MDLLRRLWTPSRSQDAVVPGGMPNAGPSTSMAPVPTATAALNPPDPKTTAVPQSRAHNTQARPNNRKTSRENNALNLELLKELNAISRSIRSEENRTSNSIPETRTLLNTSGQISPGRGIIATPRRVHSLKRPEIAMLPHNRKRPWNQNQCSDGENHNQVQMASVNPQACLPFRHPRERQTGRCSNTAPFGINQMQRFTYGAFDQHNYNESGMAYWESEVDMSLEGIPSPAFSSTTRFSNKKNTGSQDHWWKRFCSPNTAGGLELEPMSKRPRTILTPTNKTVSCRIRSTYLEKVEDLTVHSILEHTKTPQRQNEGNILEEQEQVDPVLPSEIKFTCPFCEASFADIESSNHHVATVHKIIGIFPIYCFECGLGFSDEVGMDEHNQIHLAQRNLNNRKEKIRFSCPFCQVYNFPDMEASNKHFVEFHKITGVLPIYCDLCGQGFLNSALLIIHKRIHMFAEKKTPNTGQLQPHRKNQQPPPIVGTVSVPQTELPAPQPPSPSPEVNIIKFDCPFCEASYPNKDTTIDHFISFHYAKRALPSYCNECGSMFWGADELNKHTEIHFASGENSSPGRDCNHDRTDSETSESYSSDSRNDGVERLRGARAKKASEHSELLVSTSNVSSPVVQKPDWFQNGRPPKVQEPREFISPFAAQRNSGKEKIEFNCQLCQCVLPDMESFNQHYAEFHKPPVYCDQCGVGFMNATFRDEHKIKLHMCDLTNIPKPASSRAIVPVQKDSIPDSSPQNTSPENVKIGLSCQFCPANFSNGDSFRRHLVNIHRIIAGRDGGHYCNECGLAFRSAELLDVHTITHLSTSSEGQRSIELNEADFGHDHDNSESSENNSANMDNDNSGSEAMDTSSLLSYFITAVLEGTAKCISRRDELDSSGKEPDLDTSKLQEIDTSGREDLDTSEKQELDISRVEEPQTPDETAGDPEILFERLDNYDNDLSPPPGSDFSSDSDSNSDSETTWSGMSIQYGDSEVESRDENLPEMGGDRAIEAVTIDNGRKGRSRTEYQTIKFVDKGIPPAARTSENSKIPKRRCEICSKLVCETYFNSHVKNHGESTSIPCPNCSLTFKTKDYLRKHNQHIHPLTKKKYACHQCPKEFNQRSSLQNHVSSVHQRIRFTCTVTKCYKAYTTAAALRAHYRNIHNRIVPESESLADPVSNDGTPTTARQRSSRQSSSARFTCEVDECDKSYATIGALRAHYREFHNNSPLPTPEMNNETMEDPISGPTGEIVGTENTASKPKKKVDSFKDSEQPAQRKTTSLPNKLTPINTYAPRRRTRASDGTKLPPPR